MIVKKMFEQFFQLSHLTRHEFPDGKKLQAMQEENACTLIILVSCRGRADNNLMVVSNTELFIER